MLKVGEEIAVIVDLAGQSRRSRLLIKGSLSSFKYQLLFMSA